MSTANDAQPTTPEAALDPVGSDYEDFSSAFDNLIEPGEQQNAATDTPDSSGQPAADAQQQVQPADGAGDSRQPAPAGTDTAPADAQAAQDGAGGDPAGGQQGHQNVDWEARFRELEARIAQPQQPAPAAPTPQPAPEIYTAEEQTELAQLKEDWPDLHRLFSLMARQVQVDTLNYAFSEVGKVLAPLQESVSTISTSDHMGAIYDAHADYDQVFQPVMDWVAKQPGPIRAAYEGVAKSGTAEEVNWMIQRFKDETGWAAPAAGQQGVGSSRPAAPAAAASAPAQTTGLSEAAKKAAKAMGAVGTKRGAPVQAHDPNDFDGAWDEANAA